MVGIIIVISTVLMYIVALIVNTVVSDRLRKVQREYNDMLEEQNDLLQKQNIELLKILKSITEGVKGREKPATESEF